MGDGDVVWRTRRKALRRMVQALVAHRQPAPGIGLTLEDLLAAGWPDERVEETSGRARVYTAINTLRRLGLGLGLGDLLLRNPDGDALEPAVSLDIASE